jgi:hypothetical protein
MLDLQDSGTPRAFSNGVARRGKRGGREGKGEGEGSDIVVEGE